MKPTSIFTLITFLFLSFGAFADSSCRQAYGVSQAADELDSAAQAFHDTVEYLDGYSHLSTDVTKFARAASRLHHLADENQSRCSRLRKSYNRLENKFHHLREAFQNAHRTHGDHDAQNDWQDVKTSVRYLRQAFRGNNH